MALIRESRVELGVSIGRREQLLVSLPYRPHDVTFNWDTFTDLLQSYLCGGGLQYLHRTLRVVEGKEKGTQCPGE
jgi:hypothetical protein